MKLHFDKNLSRHSKLCSSSFKYSDIQIATHKAHGSGSNIKGNKILSAAMHCFTGL